MGIGGTYSCLENTGYDGPLQYDDTNAARTSCPFSKLFPNHNSFENVCPKHQTPEQQQHYWDSPVKAQNFSGTDDYHMGKWTCPLDAPASAPSQSRWSTCGLNRAGAPSASDPENPYAKVLSGQCFGRVGRKLLNPAVGSKAFPGQCQPLYKVLDHYSAEDSSTGAVFVNLMNEPNMVDTDELAEAYKDVISMVRGAPFNIKNRLLVEGNYWAGLHAQITPFARSKHSGCGAPSSSQNGHTRGLDKGRTPLQIIHEAVASVPNAQPWTFDVHQYFDYDSTGNWDCGHGWANDTCAGGTLDQVKEFVNWDPFSQYIAEHDISVAVTEFGGHPTARCARWLRSFLTLLEDNAYKKGKGGVLLWTVWRTCPHTSWYLGINPDDPSADCLQFAAPVSGVDPPTYAALWRTTSDPTSTNLKTVLHEFM